MYEVIKNKGKLVKAYQLGSDNAVIKELSNNIQVKVKDAIKKSLDVDVKSLDIKVKDMVTPAKDTKEA